MKDAHDWIFTLNLQKHPEGGYYRETYRSEEIIPVLALPSRFSGPRVFSTAIYFLLPADEISAFHRLKSDEIWHFYCGNSLALFEITTSAKLCCHSLGCRPEEGDTFQVTIRAGSWMAARVKHREGFCLAGCTVAPGFDFADFELAPPNDLSLRFPQHRSTIEALTDKHR